MNSPASVLSDRLDKEVRKMAELIIAPSVLSMDYTKMLEQVRALERSRAKWIHYDVMDGHFVPNLSFGPDILKQFRKSTDLFLDVHLMVSDPAYFARVFKDAGADLIVFHVEALDNDPKKVSALLKEIHDMGIQAGFSLKPDTDPAPFLNLVKEADLVLIMSVYPGYGGQSFIPDVLEKVRAFDKARKELNPACRIEIDGGINAETAKEAKAAGVDTLVAGSYVFKNDIESAVESLC